MALIEHLDDHRAFRDPGFGKQQLPSGQWVIVEMDCDDLVSVCGPITTKEMAKERALLVIRGRCCELSLPWENVVPLFYQGAIGWCLGNTSWEVVELKP